MENFFLISSASLKFFPENTRAVFKNQLTKDINIENKIIYLNLEKVIFANSFAKYLPSNDLIPDIIYRNQKDIFTFKLNSVETLQELFNELCCFLNECADKTSIPRDLFFSARIFDNKIKLSFFVGDILMSDALVELLMFHNVAFQRKKDVKTGIFFNIIRSPINDVVTYYSYDYIRLNEKKLTFIKIHFDEAELQNGEKIIAKIPINSQILNYHVPKIKQYFRVDQSYLKEMKVSFLQPNNCKVFFQNGSPNILKFNVRKNLANMDFFYLTVTSKPSPFFQQNSCNNFTCELMKDYNFNNRWEVCLLNAYIPKAQNFLTFNSLLYHIGNDDNYIGMKYRNIDGEIISNFVVFPFLQFRKRQLHLFIEKNFSHMINIYVDQNEVCVLTRKENMKIDGDVQIYTSKNVFQLLNNKNNLIEVKKDTLDVQWVDGFKSLLPVLQGKNIKSNNLVGFALTDLYMQELMKRKHLCLIPPSIFYPNMQEDDITKSDSLWEEKIKSANFIEKHEHYLLKYLETLNIAEFREFTPSFFFLYCDFVEETVMGDKSVNILKIIPFKNQSGMFNFESEEYYNVNKSYLRTLSFQLRTHCGEQYTFFPYDSEVELTLKFRKKTKDEKK